MGGVGNGDRKCEPFHTISVAYNAVSMSHLSSQTLTSSVAEYDDVMQSHMMISSASTDLRQPGNKVRWCQVQDKKKK